MLAWVCSHDKSLSIPGGANAVQSVDTSGLPIGQALKVERVLARASSTEIASAVGISIGHLSRIEKGERTASDELVAQIRAEIARAKGAAA